MANMSTWREGGRPEAAMLNVGFWMKGSRGGRGGRGGKGRPQPKAGGRRWPIGKLKKIGEDVLSVADRSRQRGGAVVGGGRLGVIR